MRISTQEKVISIAVGVCVFGIGVAINSAPVGLIIAPASIVITWMFFSMQASKKKEE